MSTRLDVDKKTVLVDDGLTDRVYAATPYNAHIGRDTTNADNSIFDDTGLLTVQRLDDGYLGIINLGIDS